MPTEDVMTEARREGFTRRQDARSDKLRRLSDAWTDDNASAVGLEEIPGDVSAIVALGGAREATRWCWVARAERTGRTRRP